MSRAVDLFREARQADDTTTVGGSGDQSKHPHGAPGSGKGGQFIKNNSGGGVKPKAVAPKAVPKPAAKPGVPQQHGVLPPPTTSRTMKLGQSGDDVRNLQYAMGLLGFQVPQDGVFDGHTQAAVAQAQQRLGIKPNGHASASLLRKMQDAVRLSPCVKESAMTGAVRLFQIARTAERFDPAQPRDDHGRWSLFADAIALLRKGGHDKAASHLEEAQVVSRRSGTPAERHAKYRHDLIDAERLRTEVARLDEQHNARLFPGSRMEDPENRRLNRAQAAQRRAELAPLESRIAAHEHFFGTHPPEEDHVGTAQSHVDALQGRPELPQSELESRIRSAYDAIAARPGGNGPGGWIGLADLRQQIGEDIPRDQLDRALVTMVSTRGGKNDVRIIPVANSKALTDADRAASLRMGGENHHAIQFPTDSMVGRSGDMRDPTRARFIADRPAADARAADARKLATEQRAADAKGMSLEEWRASRAPKKTAPKAAVRAATPGSERTDNERFGGGIGKKALPPSKSASPRAEAVATDPSLTAEEKRTRLKAMGMTPEQVDSLVPTEKAGPVGDPWQQNVDGVKALLAGVSSTDVSRIARDAGIQLGREQSLDDRRDTIARHMASFGSSDDAAGEIRDAMARLDITPKKPAKASPAAAKMARGKAAKGLPRGFSETGRTDLEDALGNKSPAELKALAEQVNIDMPGNVRSQSARAKLLVQAVEVADRRNGGRTGNAILAAARDSGGSPHPDGLDTMHSPSTPGPSHSPAVAKMTRAKAAPAKTPAFDATELADRVYRMKTREEKAAALEQVTTVANLRKFATAHNVQLPRRGDRTFTAPELRQYILDQIERDQNRWSLR